jgi:hypothetical protein
MILDRLQATGSVVFVGGFHASRIHPFRHAD